MTVRLASVIAGVAIYVGYHLVFLPHDAIQILVGVAVAYTSVCLLLAMRPREWNYLPRYQGRVGMVICVRNEDPDYLARMFASVAAQTRPVDSLWVVDDASTVPVVVPPEFDAIIRLVRFDERIGKRKALACVFRAAIAVDSWVTVDSDTILEPNAVAAITRPFSDRRIVSVSGQLTGANWSRNLLTRIVDIEFTNSFLLAREAFGKVGAVVVNCFVEGETALPVGGLKSISRAWWDGPTIEIITGDGQSLTVTPNHPVLTTIGWQAAKDVKLGMKVLSVRNPAVNPDDQHRPPRVEELYEACRVSPLAMQERTRGVDFHGDVVDGEVEVVRTDRMLSDSTAGQVGFDLVLDGELNPQGLGAGQRRESRTARFLGGQVIAGETATWWRRLLRLMQPSGTVGSSGAPASFVWRGTSSRQAIGVGGGTPQAHLPQACGYDDLADTQLISDGLGTEPRFVTTADVVEINVKSGGHWVYNLESETGVVWSPAMLSSNCGGLAAYRSKVIAKFIDDYENEMFWGRPIAAGDDRSLTMMSSRFGRCVHAHQARGVTALPESMGHLVRQRLRWARSFFHGMNYAARNYTTKRHVPNVVFWSIVWQVISFLTFTGISIYILFLGPAFGEMFTWEFPLYILGLAYLRSSMYLFSPLTNHTTRERATNWLLAPLVGFLYLTVLNPVRVYGMLTCRGDRGWLTRNEVETTSLEDVAA